MNKTDTTTPPPPKSIVLIGLMGAGKTTIGRQLADRFDLDFVDSDDEVIKAAGCSIQDIFELYGEKAFRDVEARVIARLLSEGPIVLATGGGAFMNDATRQMIKREAVSVWLKADLDILVARTSGRTERPLLNNGDPRERLRTLMEVRYPVYGEADIVVETGAESAENTANSVRDALNRLTDAET